MSRSPDWGRLVSDALTVTPESTPERVPTQRITRSRLDHLSLRDVPLVIRRRFGRRFLEMAFEDGDVEAAIDWHRAIEEPSSRVYVISAEAIERVLGKQP